MQLKSISLAKVSSKIFNNEELYIYMIFAVVSVRARVCMCVCGGGGGGGGRRTVGVLLVKVEEDTVIQSSQ